MALPPMGPMSPPSPFLGGPQANMGPPPFPPMPQMGGGMGMAPSMGIPPMGPQMGPPPINPVNPNLGGAQSFGGDAGGRKTFSQYLQSMNTSFPPTPPAPEPNPMAGGIGGGAPLMPPLAMMGGGAVPRQTMIGREPHSLAYINPSEEMMLRASGGTGEPGPMGVPAFRGGGFSPGFGGGFGFGGGGGSSSNGGGGYDGGFDDADYGGFDYGMDTASGNVSVGDDNAGDNDAGDNTYSLSDSGNNVQIDISDQVGAREQAENEQMGIEGPTMGNVAGPGWSGISANNMDQVAADLGITPEQLSQSNFNPNPVIDVPEVVNVFDELPTELMRTPDGQLTTSNFNYDTTIGTATDSLNPAAMEAAYSSYNPYSSTPTAEQISNSQMNTDQSFTPGNLSLNPDLSRGLSLTPESTATDMDQLDALSDEDLDFGTVDTVGLTPSVTQDAGMGAAIANNDGFNVTVGNPMASASANVPDLGLDQGMGAAISSTPVEGTALSPNTNNYAIDIQDSPQFSTLSLAMEKEQLDKQAEEQKGKFNPLSLVPFGSLLGTSASRRQKALDQVINNPVNKGLLNTGIGGNTGALGTGATSYNAVYDSAGRFVGSQGVTKSGETVSYMGDIQGNKGYYDSNGNNIEISADIEGYQQEIGGQGAPGDGPDILPVDDIDDIDIIEDTEGTSTLGSVIRPTTRTPRPVPEPVLPVTSPTLTRPRQFNMGGATSGSNLDGAIGRLLSSMS